MRTHHALPAMALLACAATFAQEGPPSRLDAIQKQARIRVCTPGDYRPFSLLQPDGQ